MRCPAAVGTSCALLTRCLGLTSTELTGGTGAAAELGLHLGQLLVNRAAARELAELAVDVVLGGPKGGEVLKGDEVSAALVGSRAA